MISVATGSALVHAQTPEPIETRQLAFDPNRDVDFDVALPVGIAGWWPLDEARGLAAPDVTGRNAGRLSGFAAPRWTQGQLGRALAFDGASANAVVIPNSAALNPAQQVSLSAWIFSNTGGSAGPETIVSKEGLEFTQYSLRIEAPGSLRFTIGNISLVSDARLLPNDWNHVVASYDGSVMRVLVNGVAAPRMLERSGALPSTQYPVRIGSGADARRALAFNGLLDDVRIYGRGLTFVDAASIYREGLENSHAALTKHLELSQYGDTYKIDTGIASKIPAGLLKPWWKTYLDLIEDSGEPPEIKWELACGLIDDSGKLLECFFKLNPKIRDNIVWQDANPATHMVADLSYPQWSAARKQQLYKAFYDAFQWMKGGLQTNNGAVLVDPPVNQLNLPDAAPAQTVLTANAAWQLYLNSVAQSLAVEIGGFVPWSVTGYSTAELKLLFHSKYMLDAGWGADWTTYPNAGTVFGYQPAGYTMDAPPATSFQFLVAQDMIRGNHEATIERLIDWSRFSLVHITNWDDASAKAFEVWWNYRGASPASRVLQGTLGPFKGYPPYSVDAPNHNWVYGCHGVVSLYRGLLRTVNIPVDYRVEFGHGMPIWWTVGKSLSHGDDVEYVPFNSHSKWDDPSTWTHWHKKAKASEYPITLGEFYDWFEGPNQDYLNVGRRAYDLLTIKYPSDDLLKMYCYDKAHGLSHANGTVMGSLQGSMLLALYPQATLEAMGFWNTLEAESTQFGICTP